MERQNSVHIMRQETRDGIFHPICRLHAAQQSCEEERVSYTVCEKQFNDFKIAELWWDMLLKKYGGCANKAFTEACNENGAFLIAPTPLKPNPNFNMKPLMLVYECAECSSDVYTNKINFSGRSDEQVGDEGEFSENCPYCGCVNRFTVASGVFNEILDAHKIIEL